MGLLICLVVGILISLRIADYNEQSSQLEVQLMEQRMQMDSPADAGNVALGSMNGERLQKLNQHLMLEMTLALALTLTLALALTLTLTLTLTLILILTFWH